MSCEDFESLLADALGDELSPEDRPRFEEHLANCPRCRREYESSREAVATLRDLPGPRRVSVRREGDRLVIEDAVDGDAGRRRSPAGRAGVWPASQWRGGIYRYAASILIAFTAGYIAHAAFGAQTAVAPSDHKTVQVLPDPIKVNARQSLQTALASTYTRNPARSDLANALIAMAGH
jgi:anti-sigma factor RsiW